MVILKFRITGSLQIRESPNIQSLFGWIAAQIPVQPHKCSAFGLRGVAVRMHWSTAADQPKSYESCLTVVTLIEGCPRKRNSAKQALISCDFPRGRLTNPTRIPVVPLAAGIITAVSAWRRLRVFQAARRRSIPGHPPADR